MILAMLLATDAAGQTPIRVGMVYELSAGDRKGYVLPSMHSGSPVEIVLKESIRDLVATADVVAFETVPHGAANRPGHARIANDLMRRPKDSGVLTDEIPGELAARIRRVLDRRGATAKQWDALLQARVQFADDVLAGIFNRLPILDRLPGAGSGAATWSHPGIEAWVIAEAQRNDRRVEELEGSLPWLRARLALSTEEAVAELEQRIGRLESDPDGSVNYAYAERLARLLYADEHEALYGQFRAGTCGSPLLRNVCDKIVDGRNAYLATRIDALMSSGRRTFAVVGAMHVAGPRSVLIELEKRGYTIRRMQ